MEFLKILGSDALIRQFFTENELDLVSLKKKKKSKLDSYRSWEGFRLKNFKSKSLCFCSRGDALSFTRYKTRNSFFFAAQISPKFNLENLCPLII